ncbi:MAG: hypothetical protein KGJ07_00205 [Patescibacteria group bacterium]|nr:hypothetical protein [Patescibacteria group bacterium]
MGVKVQSDKIKPVDKGITVRISPVTLRQLDGMQDWAGETVTRIVIRAIDHLYNYYIQCGATIPLKDIEPKKKGKKRV